MSYEVIIAHPMLKSTVAGILVAARVDYATFKTWKSANEALTYDWKVAGWRWFQGAVIGAVTGAGLGL